MTHRRFVTTAAGIALAVLVAGFGALPASAVAVQPTQDVPSSTWIQPDPGQQFEDGVGTFIFVAAEAPTGAGQLPASNYEYLLTFEFDHLRFGNVGLATGPGGTVARLALEPDIYSGTAGTSVEISYPWLPGHFYFVYAAHLGGDLWGASILDWSTGVWSYIGAVQAPPGWGTLVPASITKVRWAPDAPRPATCAGYPRTDAYFFTPLGVTGSVITEASLYGHFPTSGDCASQTDMLTDTWVHYRLGADPTG
jgi:hypothetical protein